VNGADAALSALRAATDGGAPFALIVLDANMPKTDGFELAEQIRAQSAFATSPMVMLTSSAQHGDAARCRALGISGYLAKPVESTDLHDAIRRALASGLPRPLPQRSAPTDAARVARPLRILLAEDNVVNQRVAMGLLRKRGHDVVVAGNGLEALAALERQAFDLVLMDVQMPEMGGFEATAEIRRRELATGGHMRIVAMTAHAMTGDRERCLAVGMDEYLSKPIDPPTLFATIEREERVAPAAAPASAPPPGVALDLGTLMNRLGGDRVLLIEVVNLFVMDCPLRLTAIRAAIDRRDGDAIRDASHALKGAAANLSAPGVFDAARTLERVGTENRLDAAEAAWRALSGEAAGLLAYLRSEEFTIASEESTCTH
jgi:CheY-like chemotaxis protein